MTGIRWLASSRASSKVSRLAISAFGLLGLDEREGLAGYVQKLIVVRLLPDAPGSRVPGTDMTSWEASLRSVPRVGRACYQIHQAAGGNASPPFKDRP